MASKKFISAQAVSTAFVHMVVEPLPVPNDDTREPISVTVETINGQQFIKWLHTTVNTSTDKLLDIPQNPPDYTLSGWVLGEVLNSSGQVVASVTPDLEWFGDTFALTDDPVNFPHHSSSDFTHIYLSPQWGDATHALSVLVPTLANGNYTLRITQDPLNDFGQMETVSVPFSVSGSSFFAATQLQQGSKK